MRSKRFSIDMDGSMEPDEAGQWVRYEDAKALREPLTRGVPWRSIDTAPLDGELVLLLLDFEDHATEDGPGPHPTIGSNTSENEGVAVEWQFAGWNWEHDRYTQGVGTPVGWLPMTAQQPAPPAKVPMLTPEEIDAALHVALPSLSYDSEDAFITGVRVGEKLVRQKAGLS